MAPKKKPDPKEKAQMDSKKKTTKQASESEASDDDVKTSSESEEDTKKEAAKKVPVKAPAKAPAGKKAPAKDESESESESDSDKKKGPTKKPQPKKESSESESEESEDDAPKKKPAAKAKSSSDEESEEEEKPKPKAAPAKGKPAAAKPKAKPVVESESESSESEPEEEEEEEESEDEKKPAAKGPAGKKPAKTDADLDDILAEFESSKGQGDKQLSKAQLKRLKKKETVEAAPSTTAAPAPAADGGEKVLSKAQAKKLKKQEADKKEAEKKEATKKDKEGTEVKKTGALNAVVEKIKKQKEEMERLKKEEEERIRLEQEAEKLRLEEEERARLEKERKREEKLKKKEEQRKAGLILTKTQKEAKAKMEAFAAQLKSQGLVPATAQAPAAGEAEKKKVKYEKKKKPGKGKPGDKPDKADDDKAEDKGDDAEVPESWEAVADEEEKVKDTKPSKSAPPTTSVAEDDIPDSWDVIEADEIAPASTAAPTQSGKKASDKGKQKEKSSEKEKPQKADSAKTSEKEAAQPESNKKDSKDKKKDKEKEKEGEEPKVELRSPICCILGHVDTGKTKLLDKIRHTNVQDHEAGGITQQIGATYFPMETVKEQTKLLNDSLKKPLEYKVPGLLVIDTPGHESFTNLRSRGSNLCDIAILVVDIMHGLEPQTLESLELLRSRKTPFIVALNKIDRMYGWKPIANHPFQLSFAQQNHDAQREFEKRTKETITLFAQQGLNCCLYYENKDFRSTVSLVPTSAITGEGIPDLLMLLVQLTQNMMNNRLMFLSGLQCTVLEVKVLEGLGTTIDVILVNGVLHEGDTIVLCGMEGPIVTTIRALLTPQPLKELRVKGEYVHHKSVKAAMGIKIMAQNMEHAIPGAPLLVCGPRDDIEQLKDDVMQDLATMLTKVDRSGKGVYVQASTLGSLEALLDFLKKSKIPVSGIAIGPVRKKDVMKAAVMLEHQAEFATILAFDVKVSPDVARTALEMGVKIFTADIIYHLFDQCSKYMEEIRAAKRDAAAGVAVFPCLLEIMPQHIFRARDPIVIGVRVVEGILKIATPLCCPSKEMLALGRVTSIQLNHVEVKEAKKGAEVAIRIEQPAGDQKLMYGRHFDHTHKIYSKISRESIDLLKANFKDDIDEDGWRLIIKMKALFGIV